MLTEYGSTSAESLLASGVGTAVSRFLVDALANSASAKYPNFWTTIDGPHKVETRVVFMPLFPPNGLACLLLRQHDVPDYMDCSRHSYCGSSFIIKYFRTYFLVTAKHVWFKNSPDINPLFGLWMVNGGGYKILRIVNETSLHTGPNPEQAAQDLTIFEVDSEANAVLDKEDIPSVQLSGGMQFNPPQGEGLVAMGFPTGLPKEQIDFETGMISPRRLDLYGNFVGPGDFPAMKKMKLHDNWINLAKIDAPLKFPDALNGMCGGPVLTNGPSSRRLVGMTIMAGSELLQFIEMELIAKLVVAWVLSPKAISPDEK